MSPLLLIAVAALASSSPAPSSLPASGGVAAAPTRQELAGDPNEKVCKQIATTGSHLRRSDCRTRAEWIQLTADSRQAAHDLASGQNGFSNGDTRSTMSNGK